jgi:hypothetical protein
VKLPIPAQEAVGTLEVMAVVFKDGTSWGDAAWVKRVVRRREYMEKHIRAVMAGLGQAVQDGATREQVIDQLKASQFVKVPAGRDPDEVASARSVLVPTLANLLNAHSGQSGRVMQDKEAFSRELKAQGKRLAALLEYGGQAY